MADIDDLFNCFESEEAATNVPVADAIDGEESEKWV